MTAKSPVRMTIHAAIDLVERHGMALTPKNVKANIDVGNFTLDDLTEALRRHINAQVPEVMKERGLVITDTTTRERKPYWDTMRSELEEQLRIKTESSRFDSSRITADRAVIAFLKEKEAEFGYEVYPGLFHAEIDRIFAMHGVSAPGGTA